MARLNKADEIIAVWRAIAATSENGEGWMAMPVATGSRCSVKAGRHFPTGDEAILAGFRSVTIPGDQLPEGKGFSVRRVSLAENGEGLSWVALQRLPLGSREIFTMMAADVVSMLEEMPNATEDRLIKTFLARVRAWQKFMQPGREGVLGYESEIGLFGELEMLEALMDVIPADTALLSWVGPCDGIQDFFLGTGAIEVKTTTSPGTFPALVSSLEQFDDNHRCPLFLGAVRLSQMHLGLTLPEKIETIRSFLKTEWAELLPDFELRLLQAGYFGSFSDRYIRRFADPDIRIIRVDDAVPKLVHANVPTGILRAKYEIDIDSIHGGDLTLEQVIHLLGAN